MVRNTAPNIHGQGTTTRPAMGYHQKRHQAGSPNEGLVGMHSHSPVTLWLLELNTAC